LLSFIFFILFWGCLSNWS